MQSIVTVALFILFSPFTAHAYIGPGLGLGALGAILGVVLSVFLALLAIFWYPFKRLWGKLRARKEKK